MAQLVFDDRLAAQLETLYRTRDVLRRRRLVREALAAGPGERVLDVGCGPGFYVAELLEQVGPAGSVTGVDASPQTLALAQRRTEGAANVELHLGDATDLPVGDGAFDAALSVQVLEYVAGLDAALGELHRVLRPGGRLVIWDVDWSTVSWHSADPAAWPGCWPPGTATWPTRACPGPWPRGCGRPGSATSGPRATPSPPRS
jgi:arsenite methyltransferase